MSEERKEGQRTSEHESSADVYSVVKHWYVKLHSIFYGTHRTRPRKCSPKRDTKEKIKLQVYMSKQSESGRQQEIDCDVLCLVISEEEDS